ncbi:MAG: DMT family transporter [Alphaproteobacteria bacterium]|nr:DMT family transporter [Alphaproteobacteria bacterium]
MTDAQAPAAARPAGLRRAAGVGFVLLLGMCWGFNWPSMKLVLADFDPMFFRGTSGVVAAVAMMATVWLAGTQLHVPRAEIRPLVGVSLLNVFAFSLLVVLALRFYQASAGVIIAYTMPIWASLIGGLVLRERLGWRPLLALALGVSGLALLLLPRVLADGGLPAGSLFVLGAALFWAVGIVWQKRTRWTIPVTVLTAWQLTIGNLPFLPLAIWAATESGLPELHWPSALAWCYATFIGTIGGHYFFYRIVAVYPVSIASIASLAVPVFGVTGSAVLLGDRITFAVAAALALVLTAVSLVLFERR